MSTQVHERQSATLWSLVETSLSELNTVYSDGIQLPLFASFLTLAGILFGLHNVLVVNLYRDIYAKKEYRDFAKKVESDKNPLERLAEFSLRIRRSIAYCFIASVTQISVGSIGHWSTTLVSILVALFAAKHLVGIYKLQTQVVSSWIGWLKAESEKQDAEVEASNESFVRAISRRKNPEMVAGRNRITPSRPIR